MNLLKFFIFSALFLFAGACSQNGDVAQKDETPPPESAAPSKPAGPKVVPIVYTGEDLKKAGQAPERMAFIKGGCFRMGNDHAQEDERPEHEVCVDDYYLGRYEVTQAEWEAVMGFNPSKFLGPDRPVEQVNYYDVQEYVQKSGGACRLPTEAEWEYAARGGAESRYYWGNLMDEAYAWYEDNSEKQTHPVGAKKPNQYGLHDMMGNVWEWIADWYEPLYRKEPKDNPKGPDTGEHKVIRGGAFDSSAGALRITNRTWLHPKNRVFPKVTTYGQVINEIFNYIGFRCALSYADLKAAPDAPPPAETKHTEKTEPEAEEPATGT